MLKRFLFALVALCLCAAPASALKISQVAGGSMISNLCSLGNSGTVIIYSGTQPTNPDTALSGNTALATFTFNSSACGSATHVSSNEQVAGSLAASTVTASATGTATFARMFETGGTVVVGDFTVGTSGSDINLNSTSITSGGNVTISSFLLNEPVD